MACAGRQEGIECLPRSRVVPGVNRGADLPALPGTREQLIWKANGELESARKMFHVPCTDNLGIWGFKTAEIASGIQGRGNEISPAIFAMENPE